MKVAAGTCLGRYEVRSKLGQGGMGEVYLARDTKLDREVAIKFLPESSAADEQARKRLVREAQAAAKLDHPNICSIYEVSEGDGQSFIVMQYVEGETLDVRMKRKPLDLTESLSIATQVADALAEAHARGIIHRDMKPSNIIVTQRGQAKVMDFGLAKTIASPDAVDNEAATQSLLTKPGTIIGTVPYMSPEQVRGETVDARSDMFSFGVVLYEMVSGRQPFARESAAATASAILTKEPLPLMRYVDECPEELQRIARKCLAKDRDQRYQTARDLLIDVKNLSRALEMKAELELSAPPASTDKATTEAVRRTSTETLKAALAGRSSADYLVAGIKQHKRATVIVLAAFMVAAVVGILSYSRRTTALTEKDTILLADFDNTTGDAVFDGTLKQGLAVQLEQSPFLNIFPQDRVRETLGFMNRHPDERLTRDIAREICERQGLKAYLAGSIASLGSHYVTTLEAVNAQTGETIARQQVEAESKEQVLKSLGEAARKLREKLGESLALIQKFDVPLTEATTSSLEALKAFTLGDEHRDKGEFPEAISFYKRAVELDPNFASGYQRIGTMYGNIGQSDLAREFLKKAFALRERASERERFHITSQYYQNATKELDKSVEVMELWKQTYPRDFAVRNNLAYAYSRIGEYERTIEDGSEGIRLNPNNSTLYFNLGWAYIALGRYDEAKATFEQAHARNLDYGPFHWCLYLIAFSQGDQVEMQRQLAWASGKPNEPYLVALQSMTEKFSGRFRQSQETVRRATESAQGQNLNDVAMDFTSTSAAWNALVGNCQHARTEAANALAIARGAKAPPSAILALALCGDVPRVQTLTNELAKREPTDTDINSIWIPVILATLETGRGSPAQAIQLLQKARRYEMGQDAEFWPTYVRGQAYLRQGSAPEATAEFQKIMDHRSVSPAHLLYPLAHLGLARATALSGDIAKSRQAYEDFFAFWEDADRDIPILVEAKKEYEKLKVSGITANRGGLSIENTKQ